MIDDPKSAAAGEPISALIAAGGEVKEAGMLPDGSGFMVMSFPLRPDHWSLVDSDGFNVPPMPLRIGTDDGVRGELMQGVVAAARYAYRASTLNGKDPDMDPDALVRNMVVGLLGHNTSDGLSGDAWANPDPVPEGLRAALSVLVSARYNLLLRERGRLSTDLTRARAALVALHNQVIDAIEHTDFKRKLPPAAELRFESAMANAADLLTVKFNADG